MSISIININVPKLANVTKPVLAGSSTLIGRIFQYIQHILLAPFACRYSWALMGKRVEVQNGLIMLNPQASLPTNTVESTSVQYINQLQALRSNPRAFLNFFQNHPQTMAVTTDAPVVQSEEQNKMAQAVTSLSTYHQYGDISNAASKILLEKRYSDLVVSDVFTQGGSVGVDSTNGATGVLPQNPENKNLLAFRIVLKGPLGNHTAAIFVDREKNSISFFDSRGLDRNLCLKDKVACGLNVFSFKDVIEAIEKNIYQRHQVMRLNGTLIPCVCKGIFFVVFYTCLLILFNDVKA